VRGDVSFLSTAEASNRTQGADMGNQKSTALYLVLMILVIVAVDSLFFKHRFWERLAVNIGIVLVFGAFFYRFLQRP
jgi:hypothetical protein